MHAIGGIIFIELLIILAQSGKENHCIVILKVVDPLLTFTLLTTNIDNMKLVTIEFKLEFYTKETIQKDEECLPSYYSHIPSALTVRRRLRRMSSLVGM